MIGLLSVSGYVSKVDYDGDKTNFILFINSMWSI